MERRTRIVAALATALIAVAAPAAANAATVSVNTEQDNAASGAECSGAAGDCSIRQAIDKADPGDTVAIPAGNYLLDQTKGVLQIVEDITVAGTGQPTIDGGGNVQVFQIGNGGASPDVTISGVTVTRGFTDNEGGGILVYGTLTLTGSTVKDSKAGDGGGIGTRFTEENFPTVRVVNSTISGNQAVFTGGGISLGIGALTVVNSTITGNVVTGDGVQTDGRGGGIFTGFRARLFNATIVGNTAQGPSGGAAGGNLYNDSGPSMKVQANARQVAVPDYSIRNTIVAEGTAPSGPNCGGPDPTSEGNNLVSDGQCGTASSNGDVNAPSNVSALQDNGGPTLTRKLLPASKAINAGAAGGCTDDNGAAISPDQRGIVRPQGARCDIGAVEFAPPLAVTDQPTDVTTASATIHGNVSNPHFKPGTSHFEFGTSTAYGQTFDSGAAGAGASHDPRSMGVTGLSANTTYHYRIVVVNDDDTSFGEDVQFTTPTTPGPGPAPEPEPEPGPKPTPGPPSIRVSRAKGCVNRRFGIHVSVSLRGNRKLRSVVVTVDGKVVKRAHRRRFGVRIHSNQLKPGTHVLRAVATDSAGRKASARRMFRRCRIEVSPVFTG